MRRKGGEKWQIRQLQVPHALQVADGTTTSYILDAVFFYHLNCQMHSPAGHRYTMTVREKLLLTCIAGCKKKSHEVGGNSGIFFARNQCYMNITERTWKPRSYRATTTLVLSVVMCTYICLIFVT